MAMFAYSGNVYCHPVEQQRCYNVPDNTRTGPASKFQVQPLYTGRSQTPPNNDYNTYCNPIVFGSEIAIIG